MKKKVKGAKIQTEIEFFGQFWLRLLKCRFCSPLAFNFFCAKIVNLAAPLHSKEAPREAFECFSLAKLHLSSASNELKNLILLSSLREWEIQNSRVQQRSFKISSKASKIYFGPVVICKKDSLLLGSCYCWKSERFLCTWSVNIVSHGSYFKPSPPP